MTLFAEDSTLVCFAEPDKVETLKSRGYRPPSFEKITPTRHVKKFVSFLEDICQTPSPFAFARYIENSFKEYYSKDDKGKQFFHAVNQQIDMSKKLLNYYLALRLQNEIVK